MKNEPEIVKQLREEERQKNLQNQGTTPSSTPAFLEKPVSEIKQKTTPPSNQVKPNQTNIELENLEKVYETVFENSAVAITLVDQNERIVSWNKYTETLLGFSHQELFMKPIASLYPVEEWQRIRGENIRKKGMQYHIETRLLTKNNENLDVELSLSILKDFEGKIRGSIGIITDITKRKQMETALEESGKIFKQLYETAPVPYHTLSSNGLITNVNEKWCQIFGYKKDEVIGKPIFDFVAPEEKEAARASFEKKKMMRKAYRGGNERRYLTKNGIERVFVIHDFFSFDSNHNVISVHTTMEDVTERKHMEKTLKLSEQQFKQIYQTAPIPYHTLSSNGLITNVNEKWCQILGYKKDEVIGKPIFDFVALEEKEAARISFEKKKLLGLSYVHGNERRYKTKTGKERIFVIYDYFCYDHDNNVTGVYTTMEDITERKQMEQSLHDAQQMLQNANKNLEEKVKKRTAQVEQLLKQKDEFITQLGHDLKTPLSILLNVIPMILEEVNEKDRKDCEIALRNVNYIKNLVTETLKIAELSSLNVQLRRDSIRLHNLVLDIIKDKQLFSSEKNIIFENNIDTTLTIEGDTLRLSEVFTNILGNAIKYSLDSGGVVTVDAKKENDFVVVSVKDTGIGLESEHLSQVFNEFYKVDPSRHDLASSGLGLSICKRIIEKHGGKIWIESPGIGKGTIVYFTLPLWRPKQQ